MLAHCLGLAGELFNCLGAIILALDIFLRRKGERELRELQDMSHHARTVDSPAIYKGFMVASPHFAEDVTHWNAKRLALMGSAMLVVGFALLVGYHSLEIRDLQQNQTTPSEIRNSNLQERGRMQIMDKATVARETVRPILTKIAGKFQVTVPPEVRGLFDLREGDLLEWSYDHGTKQLVITPKRAQLLTPRLREVINESKKRRSEIEVAATV